jgi:hypothetical protein
MSFPGPDTPCISVDLSSLVIILSLILTLLAFYLGFKVFKFIKLGQDYFRLHSSEGQSLLP